MPAEHVDVLIVGAGLSGIGAAAHLQDELPGATWTIIEARDGIGGTWDLFRYPGVRSDSDMFTLGYRFRPWTDERAIADGGAIREYVRDTARERGIDRHVRFGHRMVAAEWSSAAARWTVTAATPAGSVELTCGFLYLCTGYYRYDRGHAPALPGAERFTGALVHPQSWPADLAWAGKRVVVVGSGAAAVTLVPALARDAAHVTMLQRSPSYLLSVPTYDPLARRLFARVPARRAAPLVRARNIALTTLFYRLSRRFPTWMRGRLLDGARAQLPRGFDVDTHFSPAYAPWDQRLCVVPSGDLFRAVRAGSASIVTDRITTLTEHGVALASGAELPADVVVTATGLALQLLGGATLRVDGRDVDLARATVYKGALLSGLPNVALTFGYTNASWTLKADLVATYVCRLLAHMRSRGYAVVVPDGPPGGPDGLPPLIDLRSGYVRRGAELLPRRGVGGPWRMRNSYPRDLLTLRHGRLDDGHLRFPHPDPLLDPLRSRLMQRYCFADGTAVVTGAASGIGAALATALAARGSHLVLLDRDAANLASVAERIGTTCPVRIATYVVDLADRDATERIGATLVDAHPDMTLLINNAGVALGGTFDQASAAQFDAVLAVNLHAVVTLTRALLPVLTTHPGAHLVNVSSVFGLLGPPGQTAYCTSKFAVRGFTESLRGELVPVGVGVTCVHPGGVRTGIARNAIVGDGVPPATAARLAEFDKLLTLDPADAAETILRAVERRRPRVLVGRDAVVLDALVRLLPVTHRRLLAVATRLAARRTTRT